MAQVFSSNNYVHSKAWLALLVGTFDILRLRANIYIHCQAELSKKETFNKNNAINKLKIACIAHD